MQAVILFAHGSRDPLWHLPMQAVQERVALMQPLTPVTCAYLELSQPDLPTAVTGRAKETHYSVYEQQVSKNEYAIPVNLRNPLERGRIQCKNQRTYQGWHD